MICIDCGKGKRMHRLTKLCEGCFDLQNERLRARVIDVETYNESRDEFISRKSEELGLKYSAYEIRSMIRAGMTDELILKTEDKNVWTVGSEPSRAMPIDVIP